MTVARLFEEELQRRGISFEIDAASQRYCFTRDEGVFSVCLDNLEREFQKDSDPDRIVRFIDGILKPASPLSADQIYLFLEPSDYEKLAEFRHPLSDRLDAVLSCFSSRNIHWLTSEDLSQLGLTEAEATTLALDNLDRAASETKVAVRHVKGVKLGLLETSFPSKPSLLLARGFRALIEPHLGWPLLAIMPHRSFLYLWNAEDRSFTEIVGPLVVGEYQKGGWPLSTELFRLDEHGLKAIGEFKLSKQSDEST